MTINADIAVQGAAAPLAPPRDHGISFGEAVRTWARIAGLSFGGPAGQIAVMHRILVDEKRWIGEARFLHALNYCMLLPGPEAQQLAIYIGWLLHRTKGGLVAGILFVLPGFLSILALSYVYVLLGHRPEVEGLFFGLKAAVLAIVLQAVVRIGSRAIKSREMLGIAVAAFLAIFLFNTPFPLIVLVAGCVGWLAARLQWSAIRAGAEHGGVADGLADADSALGEALPDHARANLSWSLKTSGALLLLWAAWRLRTRERL
jgi:chromate transporter